MLEYQILGGAFSGALAAPAAIAFGMGHAIISSVVDGVTLPLKYELNQRFMNLLPNPGEMLEARINNFINEDGYSWLLKFHNIAPKGQADDPIQSFASKCWQILRDSKIPRLQLEHIIQAVLSGGITKDQANEQLKHYGFRQDQLPILQFLLEPKFDQQVIFTQYMRGALDDNEAEAGIRKLYTCNSDDAKEILKLTQAVPTIQDLLHFLQRDVYNPDLVKKLGLADEYERNKSIKPWANAIGLGEATITDRQGNEVTRDILLDHWMSHWILPAPSQLSVFNQRFRPDRIASIKDQFPNILPFNMQDFDDYLRANDYLPQTRDWYKAASYNVIGRIDLRRGFNADLISDKEALEQIKDQGYNDRDSGILFDIMKGIKLKSKDDEENKKNDKRYGKAREQVLSAYKDGSISRLNAENRLLGYGWDVDETEGRLEAIDIEINRRVVTEFIKMTRSEFFLGGMDGIKTYETLIDGGVDSYRAGQLVAIWQRQQTRKRKTASTNQLIDWYSRGYISADDLNKRLLVLGWQGNDVLSLLAEAGDKLSGRIALAEAKQARTDQARQNAANRLRKEEEARAKEALRHIMSIETPANLKKWFQQGSITADEITLKLTEFGWPQEDILRFLIDIGA